MRIVLTSTLTAAATAVLLSSLATAQSRQMVPVNVQPPAAMDVVLFSLANAGKVVATTGQNGKTSFDVAALANLGKLEVFEEKCPDSTRILLVSSDGIATDNRNCSRRRVGAFLWGKDKALNVRLDGAGMSPLMKKSIIAGGAAGAAVGIAVAAGGSDTGSTTTPNPTPGTNVTAMYGNFNITASRVTDTGCNFNPSFSGQVQLSGNTDGSSTTIRMIESLTRTYSGTMDTSGKYSGSGSGNLNGFAYSGQITGAVSGNSIQGDETLNFSSGCPGKQVVYHFTGSK